nr:hypothetical protein PJ912_01650 [Pectobacterium colocasium]
MNKPRDSTMLGTVAVLRAVSSFFTVLRPLRGYRRRARRLTLCAVASPGIGAECFAEVAGN